MTGVQTCALPIYDGVSVSDFIAQSKTVAVQSYTSVYKGGSGYQYGGYQSAGHSNGGCSSKLDPPKSTTGATDGGGSGYTKKNDIKSVIKDDRNYGVDEDPTDPFYCRDDWWR